MATVVPHKQSGRPSLLSRESRARIAKLYFDEGWTATRIAEEAFLGIAPGTIRAIARAEKIKAADSDKSSDLLNPLEADSSTRVDDSTASALPCETASLEGGGI